ncbi:hypothetical protein MLGJGCBP_06728 [Rhodococcus sp. T7]|nr:hypothetical protein MLGJGCBP_09822 [Rhodococcus sp. T7]KAF0960149.1 hypothetical protein MLGJGCBP_06728 [Rhodococcus sp. T7]
MHHAVDETDYEAPRRPEISAARGRPTTSVGIRYTLKHTAAMATRKVDRRSPAPVAQFRNQRPWRLRQSELLRTLSAATDVATYRSSG